MTTLFKTTNKYEKWIEDLVSKEKSLRYRCGTFAPKMADAFPELQATSGWIISKQGGRYEHWWCVAEDGTVYDPTVSQFDFKVAGYEEYTGPRPICKCMNCGDWVFQEEYELFGGGACSKDCQHDLERYYG